ncbi:MAG: translation initiation factor IF-3 [Pseudomonadota bacterium]
MIAQHKQTRRNDKILAPEVRVIAEDGEQIGILPIEDAQAKAKELGLDLVEVVPNAEPPVCRIMDYGKYKFEMSKKAQAAKKKQKQTQVKEVKFRPGTEEADYQVKMRNLRRFIDQGDKVKVSLRFRGREMAHQELGTKLLKRVEEDLGEEVVVEQRPAMEGRVMVMMLSPPKH